MSLSLACPHLLQAARQCMALQGSNATSRQGWHYQAAVGTAKQQMAQPGNNATSRQRWHYEAVDGTARQCMARPGSKYH